MSEHQNVIAVIPKGRRNVIRVTFSTLGGHPVIDIRQYEPNGLRMLMPTIKGVNIDLAAVPALISALAMAVAGRP
jgi:hypothetical protein